MSQNRSSAVMAQRASPPDALDFFPTPPWATRALVERVLGPRGFSLRGARVWEPAAGQGHMSAVLSEYGARVFASDVFDYGAALDAVGSFVGEGGDVVRAPVSDRAGSALALFDWVITNPPFNLAEAFFHRARHEARAVALLVRTAWLEGGGRYGRMFALAPPQVVAIFAERVAMVKGRWDPNASTATSYCWCVWAPGAMPPGPALAWIGPGQREMLTRDDDVRRFGALAPFPDETKAPAEEAAGAEISTQESANHEAIRTT